MKLKNITFKQFPLTRVNLVNLTKTSKDLRTTLLNNISKILTL